MGKPFGGRAALLGYELSKGHIFLNQKDLVSIQVQVFIYLFIYLFVGSRGQHRTVHGPHAARGPHAAPGPQFAHPDIDEPWTRWVPAFTVVLDDIDVSISEEVKNSNGHFNSYFC